MLGRVALLALCGAVCACDAPPQSRTLVQPQAQAAAPPAAMSKERVLELSEQCGKKSREGFRREWQDGTVKTATGQAAADFTHHYNTKLDTCFYLLTVNRRENGNGQGGVSSVTLSKTLLDINEGEIYGEYLGPATVESPPRNLPETCRVVDIYCASEREWEVLVSAFMEY